MLTEAQLHGDRPSRFTFAVGNAARIADLSLETEEVTHGITDEYIPFSGQAFIISFLQEATRSRLSLPDGAGILPGTRYPYRVGNHRHRSLNAREHTRHGDWPGPG
jgi:hypothetical protein